MADLELATKFDGYPSLASWMSRDPDNESLIFRKFDELAARNLLYLQAEIIDLERQLQQFDQAAYESQDVDVQRALRRYETLNQHARDQSRVKEAQLKVLHEEISVKLGKYHEALLRQSQIASLKDPTSRALRTFRNWFLRANIPNGKPVIRGEAANMFQNPDDLVAVRRPADQDLLSRFLQDHWPQPRRFRTSTSNSDVLTYAEKHIMWTVAAITTAMASFLLVGAIVTLYYTSSDGGRLGALAGFTGLFALSVILLTNARRAEIFASTAAYAAVLVVFVGSDLKDKG